MVALLADIPPTDTPADNRRITEHDPAMARLKARTIRELTLSVSQLVRDLKAGVQPVQAQSHFIDRHLAILRAAYLAAHTEGQRDYYDVVSNTPGKWATHEADTATMQRRMAFYAPSVAKMAHEAVRAFTAPEQPQPTQLDADADDEHVILSNPYPRQKGGRWGFGSPGHGSGGAREHNTPTPHTHAGESRSGVHGGGSGAGSSASHSHSHSHSHSSGSAREGYHRAPKEATDKAMSKAKTSRREANQRAISEARRQAKIDANAKAFEHGRSPANPSYREAYQKSQARETGKSAEEHASLSRIREAEVRGLHTVSEAAKRAAVLSGGVKITSYSHFKRRMGDALRQRDHEMTRYLATHYKRMSNKFVKDFPGKAPEIHLARQGA